MMSAGDDGRRLASRHKRRGGGELLLRHGNPGPWDEWYIWHMVLEDCWLLNDSSAMSGPQVVQSAKTECFLQRQESWEVTNCPFSVPCFQKRCSFLRPGNRHPSERSWTTSSRSCCKLSGSALLKTCIEAWPFTACSIYVDIFGQRWTPKSIK